MATDEKLGTLRLSDLRIIDTDAHVTEPPDLWTSRLPRRWAELAPVVATDSDTGAQRWRLADRWLTPVALFSWAGWDGELPTYPPTLADADPAGYVATERLKRMDEFGLHAQVLYPNLIAFNPYDFMTQSHDRDFALACTRAYNDFLIEFVSADPTRLIPIAMVPFWDVPGAIDEIKRAKETGHRGLLVANKYEAAGLPHLTDRHWDPLYALAEDLELSINFHVAVSPDPGLADRIAEMSGDDPSASTRAIALSLMTNADPISRIVTSGVCDRFPNLKFVSVESGFGYIPFVLEALDHHWRLHNVERSRPGSLLPSEYFSRQCYGTFWFEDHTLELLPRFADNFMFETDYPHPTSLFPSPARPDDTPMNQLARTMAGLPDEVVRKVLHTNAAELYRIDP